MKKKLAAVLALILAAAFLLSGCSKSVDQLADIKKAGKIKIGLEGAWAPWNYHDLTTNALVGFDTEVAQGVADYLGVTAEFYESDWDSLLAGLESGRYDIIANGVEYTEERAKKYDFSVPYGFVKTVLIVRADDQEITPFDSLKGRKTANSLNSTYMQIGEKCGAEVIGVDTIEETVNMLVNKRVDATINAEESIYDYLKTHPDTPIKIVATYEEMGSVHLPIRKAGSEKLLIEINKAIASMRDSGKLSEISMKYFGTDITKK
jgi:cystine transport system substrate-binding protein